MKEKARLKLIICGVIIMAIFGSGFAGRDSVVTSEALGGKERYTAVISTDKPIYRPGENVYTLRPV